MSTPLVIDLLHHITRLLDVSGAPVKQILPLSEDSVKELDKYLIMNYPTSRMVVEGEKKDMIYIDGYEFEIIKNKNKGTPLGKLMVAASICKETNTTELEIYDKHIAALKDIKEGEEIRIASSNKSAKVLKINGNKIQLDKPVFSANQDRILKGEIIIFPEHFSSDGFLTNSNPKPQL